MDKNEASRELLEIGMKIVEKKNERAKAEAAVKAAQDEVKRVDGEIHELLGRHQFIVNQLADRPEPVPAATFEGPNSEGPDAPLG